MVSIDRVYDLQMYRVAYTEERMMGAKIYLEDIVQNVVTMHNLIIDEELKGYAEMVL